MFRFQSDRLKTKQKLGSGNSGAVFPYQKDPQDLKWVVKRIRADDTDALLKSLPEIVLGFSCDHPRVVPIKGYSIEQDSKKESFEIYMKLPRMQQTLLDEFKNRKKESNSYSEEEIVRHFYSLASGLEYLHCKRIYHGDIKPDNLLLDENGTLKIADTGIAKHVEEEDEYQTITGKLGTYQYTAPDIVGRELKDIKKDALAKADIWSLGVIALELCVFDFRLLNSLDREETRRRIEKHLEGLQGRYHDSLIHLIKKILSLDPKERPSIAQIQDELEKTFAKALREDILILRKRSPPGSADNISEDQMKALKQQIIENLKSFETERKQFKELISQLESDLSQQKQQHEQQIQVVIDQSNSKARQEQSQEETENKILQEKIRGLEQELEQHENQYRDHLSVILKDKENKLTSYEQKIITLEQREQIASEKSKEEKEELERTIQELQQEVEKQQLPSEEKLRLNRQNDEKASNERTGNEQNTHALQEETKEIEKELQKVRDESQEYLQELNGKDEKLISLQQQIRNSQQEKGTCKKNLDQQIDIFERKNTEIYNWRDHQRDHSRDICARGEECLKLKRKWEQARRMEQIQEMERRKKACNFPPLYQQLCECELKNIKIPEIHSVPKNLKEFWKNLADF